MSLNVDIDNLDPLSWQSGEEIPPRADAMIHSLRAFGYDITTAVADLVDNSITAGAKFIWINFYWDGQNSWISIRDNGKGMTEEELIKAMTVGSRSPLDRREAHDLGRFGLGLKTASFSQCKRFTVITKTLNESVSTRCWDLDYVTRTGKWLLLKDMSQFSHLDFSGLEELDSGTVVILESLDRVVGESPVEDENAQIDFLAKAAQVKNHLAMVFHRFLAAPNGVQMLVNGSSVKPWDPFMKSHPATQQLAVEPLWVGDRKVTVTPYVLPHHSKLTPEEHTTGSGIRGWNAHQGF